MYSSEDVFVSLSSSQSQLDRQYSPVTHSSLEDENCVNDDKWDDAKETNFILENDKLATRYERQDRLLLGRFRSNVQWLGFVFFSKVEPPSRPLDRRKLQSALDPNHPIMEVSFLDRAFWTPPLRSHSKTTELIRAHELIFSAIADWFGAPASDMTPTRLQSILFFFAWAFTILGVLVVSTDHEMRTLLSSISVSPRTFFEFKQAHAFSLVTVDSAQRIAYGHAGGLLSFSFTPWVYVLAGIALNRALLMPLPVLYQASRLLLAIIAVHSSIVIIDALSSALPASLVFVIPLIIGFWKFVNSGLAARHEFLLNPFVSSASHDPRHSAYIIASSSVTRENLRKIHSAERPQVPPNPTWGRWLEAIVLRILAAIVVKCRGGRARLIARRTGIERPLSTPGPPLILERLLCALCFFNLGVRDLQNPALNHSFPARTAWLTGCGIMILVFYDSNPVRRVVTLLSDLHISLRVYYVLFQLIMTTEITDKSDTTSNLLLNLLLAYCTRAISGEKRNLQNIETKCT